MEPAEYIDMTLRLLAALAAGGLVGLERSYRGRFAGFRTHALVCLASALLMILSAFGPDWFPEHSRNFDPTRVAQGIMTGIGFLGAGAIIKEGFTIRGLTTASSIWVTAAIGILAGVGFYSVAALGTVLTLATLSGFRVIEQRMRSETYANFSVRFARASSMSEDSLRTLVGEQGFSVHDFGYKLDGGADEMEYRMVLRTLHARNMRTLAEVLRANPSVKYFRLARASD
jgi:putative Mg2+ transporter-C (MgtC) family protein